MAKIIYFTKPVDDFVELHAACFPVGGIFTPERHAVNPFYLLSQEKMEFTNVYFTLPPEERDGRTLWRFLDKTVGDLPEDIQKTGFRVKVRLTFTETERASLRSAKWSLGNMGASFKVLGLTDELNLALSGADVAVIQMKNQIKDEFMTNVIPREGFNVEKVESTSVFDKILRDSETVPIFEELSKLQQKYKTIGPEGTLKALSEHISLEGALIKLESEIGDRDLKSISFEEQRHILEVFLSRGNTERK